jgi:gliding motility-associated-like protein
MITVTGSGGNGGYSYSLDGILYQSGNTFSVTAGNYTVYLKDANGCIKTATAVVNQPPVVTLNATATNASCNGGADGVITANAGGGVLPYTYSIDGINFQNGNTFNVLPGNFTVTVKDGNNCSKTFNVTVGLTSNILVSTRTDTAICESKSVQLTTNSNATSFLWSPATALNDPTLKSPVASPVTTTQYIVTATLGNCSKNDTILITVNQAPVPDAGLGTTICFGKNYTLNGTGGVQFLWSPASSLSNPNIASPVATPVSTTTYSLSVTDALGCSSLVIDTVTVAITPPIIVSAGPDTTIVTGQPYQLNTFITNPTMALNMYNYLWSPAFGLSNGNISNPVAIISTQQLYSVEVTTPEGCKGNASVLLKVFLGPDIYVPTGFTPNGDGKNDILKITVVGIRQFDFFRIYNRFGQMVFETKDPAVGWEGRFRFANQPTGAYIFNVQGITDKGMLIRKKGTIILAR